MLYSRFNPSDNSAAAGLPVTDNLYAWYDASSVNGASQGVPADGTAISSWKDLSGNGRDLSQATAANQPLFRNVSRNLLTYNQGATCEDGTTTNISAVSNCTSVASTTQASYGAYSLAMTASANGNIAAGQSDFSTVNPSTPYTVTVSTRAGSAARTAGVYVFWQTSAGVNIGSPVEVDMKTNSTTAWTDHIGTITSPATAARAVVYVQVKSASSGEVHYADKFGLFAGTVTAWVPPVTLLNGQPTVQFKAGGDVMASGTTYPNDLPRTVYAVVVRQGIASASGEQYVWSLRDAGKSGFRQLWSTGAGSTVSLSLSATNLVSGSPSSTTTGATSLNTAYVMTAIVSGSGQQASNLLTAVNGTVANSVSTTALLTSASSQIHVGGLATNNLGSLSGHIAAVLIYSAAHDTTTRQSIERWLGLRYGITVA